MKLPFKGIKLSKTWIVLGVAIGIGLLAAMAANAYLSRRIAAIDAKSKGDMTNVVVAKFDLKKGSRLSAENLAVRAIPMAYTHSQAIAPDSFDRLDGQVSAFPVRAGEMIVWPMVEGKRMATFSARVEGGRRALTLPVDEISSISGMLEPGDLIDLLVTLDKQGKSKKKIYLLAERLQVMATGQRSVDNPKSGERKQYSTVTLDIVPEQAQLIVAARESGKITALLRNPADKSAVSIEKITLAEVMDGKGDGDEVPVLYGGKDGKFTAESLRLGAPAGIRQGR